MLYTFAGMSNLVICSSRVDCCTVSNASLKSRKMTITNVLVKSMLVMVLERQIIAAVRESVGRNAKWSGNDKVLLG